MRKKNIIFLTLVITTVLILSTYGGTAINPTSSNHTESLEVVKEVYDTDTQDWVNSIDAQKEDIVQFRITVTYHNVTEPAHSHYAKDIIVTDMLPLCFEYMQGSGDPCDPSTGPSINELVWNFTGIIELYDGESLVITFNASIKDCCCGEQINEASATAFEYCTGETITGKDTATVNVVCHDADIEIEKHIWNTKEEIWVDEAYGKPNTEVRFKIIVNNSGECNLYNININDTLPEGLEYANDATVSPTSQIDKNISWYFPGPFAPNTEIVIEFDATLIDTIAGNEHINFVEVDADSDECCCPEDVGDSDTAKVKVRGMRVEKEVKKQNGPWVEEVDAAVGDTIRFRIIVYYYGDYTLYDIHIVDELPNCLEYANNADPEETEIDGQNIIWDIDGALSDGGSVTIEFDAEVIGYDPCDECECINLADVTANECSGDILNEKDPATVNVICKMTADAGGPYTGEVGVPVEITGTVSNGQPPYTFKWNMDEDEQYDDATGDEITWTWEKPGIYTIWLKVEDALANTDEDYATVTVTVDNTAPNKPTISGRSSGLSAGAKYDYKINTTDPDGDDVYYYIDWGDGDTEEWDGPYKSGEEQTFNHSWSSSMTTYNIRVKAKDEYDAESDWATLQVSTPKSKPYIQRILIRLLNHFPILQKILQHPIFEKILIR